MSISITQNINQSFMGRAWFKHALLLITVFLIFSTNGTHAQIHYVSKSGSNTPPYISWNTAAHKIQDAINASNRGDTVMIGVGNYYDSIKVDKRLTIIGERVDETIIRGDSVFGWQSFLIYDTCSIQGLTVITSTDSLSKKVSYGIATYMPISINNCIVKNAHFGISILSYGFEVSDVIMSNIIIGIYLSFQTPTKIGRLSNAYIAVREVYGVPQWSAQGATWVDYGAFHIDHLTTLVMNRGTAGVFNNSTVRSGSMVNSSITGFEAYGLLASSHQPYGYKVENCVLHGAYSGIAMVMDSLSVHNTILYNNGSGVYVTKKFTGDYNLYYNNARIDSGAGFYQGEHDIFLDPMFVNIPWPPPYDYDYHLQYGSPAIDAGAPWLLDADGSRSDIGVFGGPGGSSYPYQDLPPLAPKWISSKVENKTVTLTWKRNGEGDYLKSYLHRSTVQGYTPDSTTIIAVLDGSILPDTAIYTDTLPSYAIPYYYKLQSEDSTGHLSNPGNAMAVTAVSIRENNTTELFDYRLEQNYPNPFNATTMIPFSLKEEGSVTISLYTMTGERVATLASAHYSKGSYEVNADLGHLASGIYLYRIEVHNGNRIPVFRDMKKLVLVK